MNTVLQCVLLLFSVAAFWLVLTKRIRLPVISELGLTIAALPGFGVGFRVFEDQPLPLNGEQIMVIVIMMTVGVALFCFSGGWSKTLDAWHQTLEAKGLDSRGHGRQP